MNPYQPPRAEADNAIQERAVVIKIMARWLTFAIAPWGVLLISVVVWWVSWYFLAPVLFPFTAYTRYGGDWTVFSLEKMGWPINIGYSIVVAAVAACVGRSLSYSKAVACYVGVVVSMALAVHVAMMGLGYRYWYDTP